MIFPPESAAAPSRGMPSYLDEGRGEFKLASVIILFLERAERRGKGWGSKVYNVWRLALDDVGRGGDREGGKEAHSEYPLARLIFWRAASCTVSAFDL